MDQSIADRGTGGAPAVALAGGGAAGASAAATETPNSEGGSAGSAGGAVAAGVTTSTGGVREPEPDPGLTSAALVADMSPGWNVGNSLDATGADETSWGNPRVGPDLFLTLKADGMRAIRIPVTWRQHLGPAPDYLVEPSWMARVEQVVAYAVDNGLYAIVNMHHDGGDDAANGAWIRNAQSDYDGTMAKYRAVWLQIADRFRNFPHRLVFESMNEVMFPELEASEGSAAAYALLNDINQQFVDVVRSSGGTNATRHLLLAGYVTDIAKSVAGWQLPEDPAGRCILSIHYYAPWRFCTTGEETTWGTAAQIDELRARFDVLEETFVSNGIPVILGEYGVIREGPETPSRIFWIEHVTKAAHDRGIAPFLWDNGEEVDRSTFEWRTAGLVEAIGRASSGTDYEITPQ